MLLTQCVYLKSLYLFIILQLEEEIRLLGSSQFGSLSSLIIIFIYVDIYFVIVDCLKSKSTVLSILEE